MPCWYELSWRNGLIVRLHADSIRHINNIPADDPDINLFTEQFGFTEWSGDLGADWGFEHSFTCRGVSGDFVEYEAVIPCVREYKPCDMCNGSGRNPFSMHDDIPCMFCENGRASVINMRSAFPVSASLSFLFARLRYPQFATLSLVPQLMAIDAAAFEGSGGGSVSGVYGIELAGYLRSRPHGRMPEIIAAMRSAHEKLFMRIDACHESGFKAQLSDGGALVIDCPGNATGISPDFGSMKPGRGYEFVEHNMDTPMHQLQILAGLAALHDLARAAIKDDAAKQ